MMQANRKDNHRQAQPAQSLVPIEQSIVRSEPQFTKLALAAKRGMDYHREANFALSIIRESDYLQKCDPESFVEAFENLGAMGLSLNKNLGHAALIPRWNSKRKKNWAVAMPMYRGLISLATGGSVIKNVWGAAVVEGDFIDVTLGSVPNIAHKPMLSKRPRASFASMIGSYCVADINGSAHPHCTWLSLEDILSIAERSESFNPKEKDEWANGQKTGKRFTPAPSGPWVTDPGEMAAKSAFRRGFKTWPGIDRPEYAALQEAVRVDTEAETIDHPVEKGETIEGEAVEKQPAEGRLSAQEVDELTTFCVEKKLRPTRIAEAYGAKELADLPDSLYLEIKQRINKAGSRK